MATSSKNLKRRRTTSITASPGHRADEDTVEDLERPERSDIWFKDGSIVIQAENVQFKVHQSVLAKHSSVFTDAFCMPHPAGEPLVDGCPIVHLQDAAEDIKHMILALYGESDYYTRNAISFKAVAAMVRMGKKYDIDQLWDEGLRRLTADFPTTLEEWNGKIERAAEDSKEIINSDGLLFDCVNLAEEADIQYILPIAYFLCSANIENLLKGAETREDGSQVQLFIRTQRICMLGWTRILTALPGHCFAMLEELGTTASNCESEADCAEEASLLKSTLMHTTPTSIVARIFGPPSVIDALLDTAQLCDACVLYAREAYIEGREEMWDALPGYFNLPPWEELQESLDD